MINHILRVLIFAQLLLRKTMGLIFSQAKFACRVYHGSYVLSLI